MESLQKALETCKAEGLANVLAIGNANPPYCFYQADYPDYYFQLTRSEHMKELKDKFKRICEKSGIKKRYMHLTEDIIKENPNIAIYEAPSLDCRHEILIPEVPKLGMEAALKAIEEWGQPISKITHLIFCTSTGIDTPSADHVLVKLMGLRPSVQRFMIFNQGCFAGATALRLAKDLAENHPGVEENLGLAKDKLKASWHVLIEYGNMWSPCVLFSLDEMRKRSMEEGKATTGEGLEWGLPLAFGPGLTMESLLLRSYGFIRFSKIDNGFAP
ncbi:hypothetical protein PTKIN_Ptkin01aG0012800 [Pterospermum kingtungense]